MLRIAAPANGVLDRCWMGLRLLSAVAERHLSVAVVRYEYAALLYAAYMYLTSEVRVLGYRYRLTVLNGIFH